MAAMKRGCQGCLVSEQLDIRPLRRRQRLHLASDGFSLIVRASLGLTPTPPLQMPHVVQPEQEIDSAAATRRCHYSTGVAVQLDSQLHRTGGKLFLLCSMVSQYDSNKFYLPAEVCNNDRASLLFVCPAVNNLRSAAFCRCFRSTQQQSGWFGSLFSVTYSL